ncbi:hypothetical protein TNCV_2965901 [Trichonephila clavipes]|nr:hypothetical protein TNCV_2965901 [Trichonephila clavipes]
MINEGHTSKHVDSNWSTGIFVMMLSKMSAVSELFQRSCFRQSEIVRLLNVPRQTMSDAICRFKELAMLVKIQ